MLGIAILTRQWAVLVALPLIAALPRHRRNIVLVGGAVVAAGLLPFMIADRAGVLSAVLARNIATNENTLLQRLPIPSGVTAPIARIGPVLASAVIAAVLERRWKALSPERIMVVGATTACLATRMLLDTFFLYYLAPLTVFLVVSDVATRWRGLLACLWIALAWAVWLTPASTPRGDAAHAAALFVLSAAGLGAGLILAWHRPIRSQTIESAVAIEGADRD